VARVTTWWLEMTDPARLAPAPAAREGVDVRPARRPSPELSRALYAAVGADWWWLDRLGWDRGRWLAHLSRPELETWIVHEDGTPAGYAELEAAGGEVQVAYLGLLPGFLGRGLGSRLLDAALRRAWAMTDPPPRRVWLNTCSLDSPGALRAYEARGLVRYREETAPVQLPDQPPEPWPGARRRRASPRAPGG
jgi:GNAT superfamily N-acetyltransferase